MGTWAPLKPTNTDIHSFLFNKCIFPCKSVLNANLHFPGRIFGSIFEKVLGSPHLKKCKLCGKLVRGRKHRFVHMPGTYACPYCPCVYTRSDNLNAHVRVKHGKPKSPTTPTSHHVPAFNNNSNSSHSNATSPTNNTSSATSTLVSLISAAASEFKWTLFPFGAWSPFGFRRDAWRAKRLPLLCIWLHYASFVFVFFFF